MYTEQDLSVPNEANVLPWRRFVLAISIVILLVPINWGKLNAMLALLVTAFCAAILNGMTADAALKSILKGFGDTLGSLALMILASLRVFRGLEPTAKRFRWDRKRSVCQ